MSDDPHKLAAREARLKSKMDATWARYRYFIVGLTGLYGEIMAAHLAVEAELEGRLRLLTSNPDAILERASYAQKIGLLIALWPGDADALKGGTLDAIKGLGTLRNAIAHGRPEDEINQRLDTWLGTHRPGDTPDRVTRLRGLTLHMCGYLCGLTEGVQKARMDPDWSPDFT